MRTIEFDGDGRPKVPGIVTGTVLLLVQNERVVVVRLELLPPDELGPSLEHALNEAEIADDAIRAVREVRPDCMSSARDWVLECPPDIAERARFRE